MKWVGWDNYSFVAHRQLLHAGPADNRADLAVRADHAAPVVDHRGDLEPAAVPRPQRLLVLYLLPTVISIVAVSLVFRILYDPTAGPMKWRCSWFRHLPPINWLGDETSARVAILLVRIWETIGLGVLFFAAALQAISQDYYDAASVDGSGPMRQFCSITVPLLSRTILFMMV